jgi:hypothetical protein
MDESMLEKKIKKGVVEAQEAIDWVWRRKDSPELKKCLNLSVRTGIRRLQVMKNDERFYDTIIGIISVLKCFIEELNSKWVIKRLVGVVGLVKAIAGMLPTRTLRSFLENSFPKTKVAAEEWITQCETLDEETDDEELEKLETELGEAIVRLRQETEDEKEDKAIMISRFVRDLLLSGRLEGNLEGLVDSWTDDLQNEEKHSQVAMILSHAFKVLRTRGWNEAELNKFGKTFGFSVNIIRGNVDVW